MSNLDDNVTPLFGDDATTAANTPAQRRYTIKLKDQTIDFGPIDGYLVTNGYIVCILDEYENANSVKFLANQGDVLYVLESDEVTDED